MPSQKLRISFRTRGFALHKSIRGHCQCLGGSLSPRKLVAERPGGPTLGARRAQIAKPKLVNSGRYVCAFRGCRDNYQVPAALQDAGALALFITDAYVSASAARLACVLPRQLGEKIRSRRAAGLPDDRVRCLWATTAREHLRTLLGKSPFATYALLDRQYSLAAAHYARQTRANLFLYSPYAWEAFSARYAHDPRKILFQFHPHASSEISILKEDARRFAGLFADGLRLESSASIENLGAREQRQQLDARGSCRMREHVYAANLVGGWCPGSENLRRPLRRRLA